jgi:hypothetical protein
MEKINREKGKIKPRRTLLSINLPHFKKMVAWCVMWKLGRAPSQDLAHPGRHFTRWDSAGGH